MKGTKLTEEEKQRRKSLLSPEDIKNARVYAKRIWDNPKLETETTVVDGQTILKKPLLKPKKGFITEIEHLENVLVYVWTPGRRLVEQGPLLHKPENIADSTEHLEQSKTKALGEWEKGIPSGKGISNEEMREVGGKRTSYEALLNRKILGSSQDQKDNNNEYQTFKFNMNEEYKNRSYEAKEKSRMRIVENETFKCGEIECDKTPAFRDNSVLKSHKARTHGIEINMPRSVFASVNPMTTKRKFPTEEFDEEYASKKWENYQYHIEQNKYTAKAYWVIGVPDIYTRGMTAEEAHDHDPPITDQEDLDVLAVKMEEDKDGHCPDLKARLKIIKNYVPFLPYFPGSLIKKLQVCPGVIEECGSLTLMKEGGYTPYLVKSESEQDIWSVDIKRRTRFKHGASALFGQVRQDDVKPPTTFYFKLFNQEMAARVLAPGLLKTKDANIKLQRLAFNLEECPVFDLTKDVDSPVDEKFNIVDGDCTWSPTMYINSEEIYRVRF